MKPSVATETARASDKPKIEFFGGGGRGGREASVAQLLSPFSFLGRELAFSGIIKDIVKGYFPAVKLFDYM